MPQAMAPPTFRFLAVPYNANAARRHHITRRKRRATNWAAYDEALHRLMPGHEPRPHSHVHEQIVLILVGTIRFHVNGEQHLVGPNGLLAIPPSAEHWGEVVGDEPVPSLDIFTPKRPEYL